MSQIEKLIAKARNSPQNVTFGELCKLCRHFGMKRKGGKGSHRLYKRKKSPIFKMTLQDNKGKAVTYQVRQLFDKVKEHKLYDFGEED